MKLESLKNVATLLSTKEMGSLVGGVQDLVRGTNKDANGNSTDSEEGYYYVEADGCTVTWKRCTRTEGADGTRYEFYPDSYKWCSDTLGKGDAGTTTINRDLSKFAANINFDGAKGIDRSYLSI